MPASSCGRRLARFWNTNASISMPSPLIAQPSNAAPGPALRAMFCGREKMPAPTIDPTTSAVSAGRPSRSDAALMGSPRRRRPGKD
ncbi:hypothetical protein D3C71_936810 [compost metagenome]